MVSIPSCLQAGADLFLIAQQAAEATTSQASVTNIARGAQKSCALVGYKNKQAGYQHLPSGRCISMPAGVLMVRASSQARAGSARHVSHHL